MLKLKGLRPPGMRAVKTGLAVAVLCILYRYFYPGPGTWPQGALLAGMAAIICMQGSVDKTIRAGVNRLIGTSVGAAFACVISLFGLHGVHFFLWLAANMAALVLLIYFFNLLRKPESVTIGCMVFVMIILGVSDNPVLYSALRLFDTVVAIIITALVNRFVFKPKPAELPKP